MKKRSGLGTNPFEAKSMGIFAPTEVTEGNQVDRQIALSKIVLPKQQPRRYFDPDKMQQLIDSVREHGILEPLLVRPRASDSYELIAGERRYRAAKAVGLKEVPVVVREFNDEEALQIALVENLQREDLNPVEETEGILNLLALKLQTPVDEVPQLLHRLARSSDNVVGNQLEIIEAMFKAVGTLTWESFATHRLPLLNLPEPILEALRLGEIEYTKARAIAKVKDLVQQQTLLDKVIQEKLSLAQIRTEVAAISQLQKPKSPVLKREFDEVYSKLKKSNVWGDQRKEKRLKRLLSEIKSLLDES